ncbi:DUF3606 domain-containing protein [Pseudoroseomonas globiformis]|uniref:DUF3606 domain-containing protein n=1 Tax=Teichococcus globiformis TaxID=2307229 RepID=A0ABV7G5K3_9PROT
MTEIASKSDKTLGAAVGTPEEVAYLAKRLRVSPAIIQEAIRRIGSAERAAVEREVRKGLMRR